MQAIKEVARGPETPEGLPSRIKSPALAKAAHNVLQRQPAIARASMPVRPVLRPLLPLSSEGIDLDAKIKETRALHACWKVED